MTKSQRRVLAQEARDKAKKTGLKCEECDGEVIKSFPPRIYSTKIRKKISEE